MRYIVVIAALLLAGCDQEAPREEANDRYQTGYDMGHAAGVLEEHAQLCSQIANYRAEMAAALREAGICPKPS